MPGLPGLPGLPGCRVVRCRVGCRGCEFGSSELVGRAHWFRLSRCPHLDGLGGGQDFAQVWGRRPPGRWRTRFPNSGPVNAARDWAASWKVTLLAAARAMSLASTGCVFVAGGKIVDLSLHGLPPVRGEQAYGLVEEVSTAGARVSRGPGPCLIRPRLRGRGPGRRGVRRRGEVEDLDDGGEVDVGVLPTQVAVPK